MEEPIRDDAMPPRVAEAFYDYLSLPRPRSLKHLAAMYRGRGVGPAIATLKRWSMRYGWQKKLLAHDRMTVRAMDERFKEEVGAKICSDAQAIAAAKQRFYDRCVDPNDPNLTPAQRRRALVPTLADFRRLIKIEQMLLASMPEPIKTEPAGDGNVHFTPEELQAMMEALNRVRHKLPPQ